VTGSPESDQRTSGFTQPKRNVKPFCGQIAGLNTGEGTLPFPTREETILPSNFDSGFKTSSRQLDANRL
jgi:hypothetical protein